MFSKHEISTVKNRGDLTQFSFFMELFILKTCSCFFLVFTAKISLCISFLFYFRNIRGFFLVYMRKFQRLDRSKKVIDLSCIYSARGEKCRKKQDGLWRLLGLFQCQLNLIHSFVLTGQCKLLKEGLQSNWLLLRLLRALR